MIVHYNNLKEIRNKHNMETIVLCKGSFDMFHVGHLNLLKSAKKLGDILVVIIKSDEAVKLKGLNRPVINEKDRSTIIDAIKYVDYTIIANENFNFSNFEQFCTSEQDLFKLHRYGKIILDLEPNILLHQEGHKIPDVLLGLYAIAKTKIETLPYTDRISTTKIISDNINLYTSLYVSR